MIMHRRLPKRSDSVPNRMPLAVVAATVAIIIAGLTAVGTEAKGVVFAKAKVAAA